MKSMAVMELLRSAYRGRRVLVTGHTGFKGAWLTRWLLRLGAQVGGYSNGIPSSPSLFEALSLQQQVTHFEGDIRDYDPLLTAIRGFAPEIVFHLAAQPLVRQSYDEPKPTFDTNVGGTINVLEAIRNGPSVSALVVVTTDKCYENRNWVFGYRENDPLGGEDPYSASKACAEIVTHAYANSFFLHSNVFVGSVRAGNVVGGGDWACDRLIPDCVRGWYGKETVTIRYPLFRRPWQHVLEPLSGYLLMGAGLLRKEQSIRGQAFNFGPPIQSCCTVRQVLEYVSRELPGFHWSETPAPDSRKEAPMLALTTEKANSLLGWSSKLSLPQTFQLTFCWYRAYYEDKTLVPRLTEEQIARYEEWLEK